MGRIKSFKIPKNSKIGGYKIKGVLGRGWEGEVYECMEGATGAPRAIKLFPADEQNDMAYVMHYAWYLEKLSHIGITPRYYHMGMEFDYEIYRYGFYYIVQELFVKSPDITIRHASKDKIHEFLDKLKVVHALGFALGEWGSRNQCIDLNGNLLKLDFDPGKENSPNKGVSTDVDWFNKMFKKRGISY